MSYTALLLFTNKKPSQEIEFRNSHGGASRIWDSLFDKYIKDPQISYHHWLMPGEAEKLWDLAANPSLPMFERVALGSTFDMFYVAKANFARYVADLRKFVEVYPVPERVDHLSAWADAIEKLGPEIEAVAIYGTSTSDNPWVDPRPKSLSKGYEVYADIENDTIGKP